MSGGTTSTTLRNLDPDTVYSVAVVPVYPDVDGIREEEKGKTSEWQFRNISPLVSDCEFMFIASFMPMHS